MRREISRSTRPRRQERPKWSFSSWDEPNGFVVQGPAFPEIRQRRSNEHVRAGARGSVSALRQERDVTALARVVAQAHLDRAERRLDAADRAVFDAARSRGVYGELERQLGRPRPLRAL